MDQAETTPNAPQPRGMDIDAAAARYMRVRAGALKMNQTQLSAASGIPTSTLNRYWKGERPIRMGDLRRIIDVFGDSLTKATEQIERIELGLE